jgi:hypothetical protein
MSLQKIWLGRKWAIVSYRKKIHIYKGHGLSPCPYKPKKDFMGKKAIAHHQTFTRRDTALLCPSLPFHSLITIEN